MISAMIETLAVAFIIGLTGALAPGPTLVATVNSSLNNGWKAGPKIAAGHALVELLIFLLIVLGLAAAVQQQQQQLSHYIALVGGLALIAFGLLTVMGSRNASMVASGEKKTVNPYVAGVLTSAANPYFWIWWLSIGMAMVIDGLAGGLILACLFMIGHWGADFGWYTLVSASLDRGKKILSEANYRRVLALCGCLLMLFGIYYLSRA